MEIFTWGVLVVIGITITKPLASLSKSCNRDEFNCGFICFDREVFCDGFPDCGSDGLSIDERYCDISSSISCPTDWMRCRDYKRCVPQYFECDGHRDCLDGSDEHNCYSITETPRSQTTEFKVTVAKNNLIHWFLRQRKNDSSTEKWGPHIIRIATALFLANESFFAPESRIGEEMAYEINFQLLYKVSGNNTLQTQEIPLYIHALLVTCSDPRNFFGHDLVAELRRRIDGENYTNPFAILALCNAGDSMMEKDVERVTMAFDLQHRPFWTDTQAIAAMALQCISIRSNLHVNERMLHDMERELKKRQFRNGTVDNLMATALVVQALLYNGTYNRNFDREGAMIFLLENQNEDGSWGTIQNSYYVLPVLSKKNFLNISSKHCRKSPENEEEALTKLQEARGEKFEVQYSVWIGDDVTLGQTWRLKMTLNNTFYDVIETVKRIDSRHKVLYNVVENKPYVSALYGKQDDPELGMYWFTYLKPMLKEDEYRLVNASPVDVVIQPNQELILWYKYKGWSDKS